MHVIAPTVSAMRRPPYPISPTLSISDAKMGNRAVAPPNITAKRSKPIAPMIIWRDQIYFRPASRRSMVTGSLLMICVFVLIRSVRSEDVIKKPIVIA